MKEGRFLITETSISPLKKSIMSSLNGFAVDIPDFMRIAVATSLSESGVIFSLNNELVCYCVF